DSSRSGARGHRKIGGAAAATVHGRGMQSGDREGVRNGGGSNWRGAARNRPGFIQAYAFRIRGKWRALRLRRGGQSRTEKHSNVLAGAGFQRVRFFRFGYFARVRARATGTIDFGKGDGWDAKNDRRDESGGRAGFAWRRDFS